jgi:AraC family transcriptional regulator
MQAKKEGAGLKSYHRLHLKLTMEGGSTIDYSIVHKAAFEAVVTSRSFLSENCGVEIPLYWQEYRRAGLLSEVCGEFGIRLFSGAGRKEFEYCIGCQTKYVEQLPENFKIIKIPSYTWAVFKCTGPMPEAIQKMWGRIYTQWLPQAKYEFLNTCDIEYYTNEDIYSPEYRSEIWIPVREKG